MGLFGALKKIISGSKKQEKTPVSEHVQTAKTTVQVQKKRTRKKPQKVLKKQLSPENLSVENWKNMVEELQKNPLTQAKIVNEQLLNEFRTQIETIQSDVNDIKMRMDRVELKQDETLKVVKNKAPKPKSAKIRLSSNDQKLYDLIKDTKIVQAGQIAEKLNISRSNASLKLNKLATFGLLDKEQDGKDMLYKLKQPKEQQN